MRGTLSRAWRSSGSSSSAMGRALEGLMQRPLHGPRSRCRRRLMRAPGWAARTRCTSSTTMSARAGGGAASTTPPYAHVGAVALHSLEGLGHAQASLWAEKRGAPRPRLVAGRFAAGEGGHALDFDARDLAPPLSAVASMVAQPSRLNASTKARLKGGLLRLAGMARPPIIAPPPTRASERGVKQAPTSRAGRVE